MAKFLAGFLVCYLLAAVPVGIIVSETGKPTSSAVYYAVVWPSVMFRVATASHP